MKTQRADTLFVTLDPNNGDGDADGGPSLVTGTAVGVSILLLALEEDDKFFKAFRMLEAVSFVKILRSVSFKCFRVAILKISCWMHTFRAF